MATKQIPYEQALKLATWLAIYPELNAVVQDAQKRLDGLRKQLVSAAEFVGIPLDKGILNVKLEDGPDKRGFITIEWEENNVP